MPLSIPAALIAIILFALVANALQPSVSAVGASQLDTSAEQLASLLRQTQAQAIRLQTPLAVTFDPTAQTLRSVTVTLPGETLNTSDPVRHPTTKQPLVWQPAGGISLTPADNIFQFGALGSANELMFDNWGTPVRPRAAGVRVLTDMSLQLSGHNGERNISITSMNGRVVVL